MKYWTSLYEDLAGHVETCSTWTTLYQDPEVLPSCKIGLLLATGPGPPHTFSVFFIGKDVWLASRRLVPTWNAFLYSVKLTLLTRIKTKWQIGLNFHHTNPCRSLECKKLVKLLQALVVLLYFISLLIHLLSSQIYLPHMVLSSLASELPLQYKQFEDDPLLILFPSHGAHTFSLLRPCPAGQARKNRSMTLVKLKDSFESPFKISWKYYSIQKMKK